MSKEPTRYQMRTIAPICHESVHLRIRVLLGQVSDSPALDLAIDFQGYAIAWEYAQVVFVWAV
jgi:hypothetical protein